MLIDFGKSGCAEPAVPDVCVLGAGAAGISLALELRRRGKSVVVLEGGAGRFDERSQRLNAGESVGLAFDGLLDGRFRVLGGGTTQWGGQVLEIDDFVFGPRPWVGAPGWPFPKSELAPFYQRAIELEGLQQAQGEARAVWKALGLEAPDLGEDLVSDWSLWCPQTDFWKLHGPELARDPGCVVYTGANATGLLVAEGGDALAGVQCRSLSGRSHVFQARNYVACLGGLETCRLLLQPAADGRTAPWARSGMLGRHLQEHLVCTLGALEARDPAAAASLFDYASVAGLRYHPKLKLAPQAQARLRTLDVCGTVALASDGEDDLERAFKTFRMLRTGRAHRVSPARWLHLGRHLPTLAWHKAPYSRRNRSRQPSTLRLVVHCEQSPISESRLELTSERDELGMARARVTWRTSELERHSIRSYVTIASEALARAGVGVVKPDPGVLDDDSALEAKMRESYHHMGGLRMSEAPAEGVVDPSLRLHGARNAYACTSAVFPCSGFANPTHTIIALAARLADHLARQ